MKISRSALLRFAALVSVSRFLFGTSSVAGGVAAAPASAPSVAWIDTHAHPHGGPGSAATCFDAACLNRAFAAMERAGVQKMLLMPMPAPGRDGANLDEQIPTLVRQYPDRFAFVGGGGLLNPIIQQAGRLGQVTSTLRQQLEARAAQLIEAGAVGFGETTALHLSYQDVHPFEQTPPDHPIFLLLADLAAHYDVPIDLHMDPVAEENLPTPQWFRQASPNNPPALQENVSRLERLLAYNRAARIVWAHAGRDTTGQVPVELLWRLLEAHPNLYLQIVVVPRPVEFIHNTPLDASGSLRPEWEALIRAFPDRFVLGTDAFLGSQRAQDFAMVMESTGALLDRLPLDLAQMVGYENAVRIYKLDSAGAG